MNNLSEEDMYLINQGIDPFYDGPTQPMPMEQTDDELLKALAARKQYKAQKAQEIFKNVPETVPANMRGEYTDEYNYIMNNGNDPLLMFILQKNAKDGFTSGPIGSDGYYEQYDPALDDRLSEEYNTFLSTYYK